MNWYIVQAYSGFEKKVVETIKDELKKNKLSEKLEEILDKNAPKKVEIKLPNIKKISLPKKDV